MTIQVTIDGVVVQVAAWNMEQRVGGESTASFEMSSSMTVRPSSVITVLDGSGAEWHGMARSVARHGASQKIDAIDVATMSAWSHPSPRFKYGDIVVNSGLRLMVLALVKDGHATHVTYDCLPLGDPADAVTGGTGYYYEDEMEALDE